MINKIEIKFWYPIYQTTGGVNEYFHFHPLFKDNYNDSIVDINRKLDLMWPVWGTFLMKAEMENDLKNRLYSLQISSNG